MAKGVDPDLRSVDKSSEENTEGETSPAAKYTEALNAGDDPHQDFVLVPKATRSKGIDWWKELGLVEDGPQASDDRFFAPRALTGRYSSSEPEMQRMPPKVGSRRHLREQDAYEARFKAGEDFVVADDDLAKLEMRIAATTPLDLFNILRKGVGLSTVERSRALNRRLGAVERGTEMHRRIAAGEDPTGVVAALDEARKSGQFVVLDDFSLMVPPPTPEQRTVVNDLLALVSAAIAPTDLEPFPDDADNWKQGLPTGEDTVVGIDNGSSSHQIITPAPVGIQCGSCDVAWYADSNGMVTMQVSRGVARVITDETVQIAPAVLPYNCACPHCGSGALNPVKTLPETSP